MQNFILILSLSLFWFSCDNYNQIIGPENVTCTENFTYGNDYWGDGTYCYSNEDIEVLQNFIDNSAETLNVGAIDWYNDDGTVQWYELGFQRWNNGKIVEFNTRFIPSWSDNVFNCNLSGEIPPNISNWTEITDLYLGYHPRSEVPLQTLTGNIPNGLAALTKLQSLYLQSNSFSGQLPDIFEELTDLEILWLDNNNFEGQLPESLWSLTSLKQLYLEHNQFEGTISSNISNLINLEHFWINHNSLSGNIPDEIFTLHNLIKLKLNNNSFQGTISNEISNLNSIEVFDISHNQLEGLIPHEICDLEIDFQGSWSDLYYLYDINNFGVTDNSFCPNFDSEYPSCIEDYIGIQNIDNCVENVYNFKPLPLSVSTKSSIK